MIKLLVDNPLLLLFIIAAISYPLGRIKIKGSSLGVATVLFVSLAVGAISPELKLPEVVYMLGAVLFVYTLGLSSGPAFFASFRGKGLRNTVFGVIMLIFAAGMTAVAFKLFALKSTVAAGLYAGALTCTPALAGIVEFIKNSAPAALRDAMLAEPVVGYSIAYPIGVLGPILSILIVKRLARVDYAAEARQLEDMGATSRDLVNRTIRITRAEASAQTLEKLLEQQRWEVNYGRIKHNGRLRLIKDETCVEPGDLITVVGTADEVNRVTAYLGEESPERLELDRSEIDFRRVFVSNPDLAGRRLGDLNLRQRYGAIATRVRRGDVEMLAQDDITLELGDRVRVVAYRNKLEDVSRYFGDSYRALSEIDVLTFSLGIALGLVIGLIPIPLPGGVRFTLGFAGGPLIVALVLGALERTGPLVWTMPYSANLTLRQVGLTLFLAGIGTRAGYAFVSTFAQGNGLLLLAVGAVISTATALLTLAVGYKLLKIPLSLLSGMMGGLQTQPAVLGFALQQTNNDLPNIGYATTYPLAVIVKILLAQLLVAFLR